MMQNLVTVLNLVGIIAFVIAAYFSVRNYSITKFASHIWLIFTLLCILSAVYGFLNLINDSGLSLTIYSFLIGFFTCLVFLYTKEQIKLV